MAWSRPLRRALGVAFGVFVTLLGCSSDPEGGGYCDSLSAAAEGCTESNPCDGALTGGCANLDQALSTTTLNAARDCLESGICGVTACFSRAPASAKPTAGHEALAKAYCGKCASDIADCTRQFYAKQGKLPGVLVLPYAEAVATAVAEACTQTDDCRTGFVPCANETIDRVLGEALGAELARCTTNAFRRDAPEGSTPGGGPTVETCTPENCAGCCRDDKCEPGDGPAACGTGAAGCQTCSGAQRCVDGACKEPCGPDNCVGCCDGDTCAPGTAAAACGDNGAACTSCTTRGASFLCSNKQCIDGSCKANCAGGCCSAAGCQNGTDARACGANGDACVDCGSGRICNGATRTCVLDPNATFDLFVSSATIPTVNTANAAWDLFNGAPDPYVTVSSSEGGTKHSGQTTTKQDTAVPSWGEVALSGITASELLNNTAFEIWDADLEFDDYVGGCKLPISPPIFNGSLYFHVCPPTPSGVEVKLFFRIRKH